MKASFIHIGLGKCASTSLQGLWANSENYKYSSLNPVTTHVNKLIVDNRHDLDSAFNKVQSLNVDYPKPDNKKVNVFSSEGVTFSFINDFKNGDLTQFKQQAMAVSLKGLSSKVLILVRDPIKWIISAHAQHIKEGGTASFEEFLVGAQKAIYHNLDINFIKSAFENQEFEVVILPIELIKSSEDEFWKVYEDKLDIDRPTNLEFPKNKLSSNTTNSASLPLHLKLNKILKELSSLVKKSSPYTREQNELILAALEDSRCWGTRAALVELSKTELERLTRLLQIDSLGLNHDFTADTDLKAHLQNNFIEPLLEKDVFPCEDILATYKESICG